MCCFINLHQCRYCSHGSVKSLHDCHTTYCGALLVNHVLMCEGTKLYWKIHCGYIQVMKLNAALCSVDSCHLQAAYFKNSKVISTRKWQAFVWAWMKHAWWVWKEQHDSKVLEDTEMTSNSVWYRLDSKVLRSIRITFREQYLHWMHGDHYPFVKPVNHV